MKEAIIILCLFNSVKIPVITCGDSITYYDVIEDKYISYGQINYYKEYILASNDTSTAIFLIKLNYVAIVRDGNPPYIMKVHRRFNQVPPPGTCKE